MGGNYEEFLAFKFTYEIKDDCDYQRSIEFGWEKEQDLDKYILNKYLESKYDQDNDQDDNRYYDLQFNILRDFPTSFIREIMEVNFNSRRVCYKDFLHIELVKYTYHIWNDRSHELYDIVDRISSHLVEVANMSSEQYYDILHNKDNQKYDSGKHYMYYTWWLYAYYPLLEDGEELILKLIKFAYLEDAQDMLMYGIYQMEHCRLFNFTKKFMVALDEASKVGRGCFDLFTSGTGATGQFKRIIDKLKERDYDILNDKEIEYLYRFTDSGGNEHDYKKIYDL
jgi:hypothetical protein